MTSNCRREWVIRHMVTPTRSTRPQLEPLKFILAGLLLVSLYGVYCDVAQTEGPRKEEAGANPRYSLPPEILARPFRFVGEVVPLDRPDVRARIVAQINVLLLDARSVLTLWLEKHSASGWIFEEIFHQEGIPRDFVWLAPILSRMKRTGWRWHQGGVWALQKPCASDKGMRMATDDWHDDRMDLELSTRCFASRIRSLRKDLGQGSWLMPVAAYVTSRKTIEELKERWKPRSYWDLPLSDNAEYLIPRWIALSIISSHRQEYGLKFKAPPPLTFDQVTGVILLKDLPIGEIARMIGVPARVILELNPKIKPSAGVFSAKVDGKRAVHTIAAPRGKGWVLVNKLKKEGFLGSAPKH